MLQKGADRPGLFAAILGVEQALRISLFWLLIPRYQFWGFYYSLLITVALKVTVAWMINHLAIVKLRIFIWQMLLAPAIAGLANFTLLWLTANSLHLSGRLAVILFFFGASLLSFFVCFFVCGLVGGMDCKFADELDRASQMTGPLRPLTRLFYFAARAGWSLSPLHDRFPITIAAAAMEQAKDLELRRSEKDQQEAQRVG